MAQTQTTPRGKPVAPVKVNAKAAADDKAKAKPKATAMVIHTVSKGALSTDVGPKVVVGLAATYKVEEKANAMLQQVEGQRYDLLASMTEAFAKAAKADPSIVLSDAFKNDKAVTEALFTKLRIAIGISRYHDTGKGKQRLVYTDAVAKYFPSPKDVKGSDEAQRKATLRSNFSHMVKKCARAANSITELGIKVRQDKGTGTLAIAGPAVEKQFGQKEVLLNEKQTVEIGDKKVKLKDRPSFTALGAMSAAKHGAVVERKSTARGAKVVVDPEAAIVSLSASLVAAIGKLGKLSPKSRTALESVQSAVDAKLDA